MKIVLSRKGFDTGSGGSFSPYDHESGKYISFPIPEKVGIYPNKIRYSDIQVKDDYIAGLRGTNLSEVYQNWKGKDRVKLRQNEYISIHDTNLFAHVDPMLGTPPWLVENDNCIIGKGFGQFNASPQLERHQVKEGSIFLFFGGFQSTTDRKIAGHYLYGWLKVKKRLETYEECLEVMEKYNLSHHPHITEEAFKRNKKNYIYLPDEWLFEDLNVPGIGYFTTLNDRLLLSNRKDQHTGTWKLPGFFYKNLTQVHHKTWKKTDDGCCIVQTGIGQEFITDMSAQGKDWLRELFEKNKHNIYHPEKELSIKDFRDYLSRKHTFKKGEKKLKPISIEQYINRLESMRRHHIYNEEDTLDSMLESKIKARYKDWKTYRKTIEHYLEYKKRKSH